MIDYTGFGEKVLTFKCTEDTAVGDLVKVYGNDTVSPAANGEEFIGVAVCVRNGIASVATDGFAEVSFSGTAPALGAIHLVADGAGGVKTSESGKKISVLRVDNTAKTVGFIF